MINQEIQVLRTIDKLDRLGLPEVIRLLGEKEENYGANLDKIQITVITDFFQVSGNTNKETISNLKSFFAKTKLINERMSLIAFFENIIVEDGYTLWDYIIDIPTNEDETWSNGKRPKNIGWALDDLFKIIGKLND